MPSFARFACCAVLAVSASAQAGYSRFGWLNDTDTLPERSVELITWLWEENGSPGSPEQTNLMWAPAVGVTDRLELLIPVQLEFDQLDSGLATTFDHFSLEARYQLTNPDRVERGPFGAQVRAAVGRLVNARSLVQLEAGAVFSLELERVRTVVDLQTRFKVGGAPWTVDLLPGAGVSVRILGDLRLGAEVTSQLDFTPGHFSPWVAVGPDVSWQYGRFWVSGGFLFGVIGIRNAPRVNFGVTF